MQSKVSMVVPCYNKVRYISDMLDSVIKQDWNNVEIVLVNDGSTDGTRETISKYKKKLEARGYKVIILDQENQGVAGAIKNGLELISGEFVCFPDCDDLLHTEYVSAMVNALKSFPEVNCVVCDVVGNGRVSWSPSENELSVVTLLQNEQRILLKKFILASFFQSACVMMMRTSLLSKLCIVQNFKTNVKTTQEQQIWLPILASEKAIIHLNRKLYTYIERDMSIETSVTDINAIYDYAEDRYELTQKILNHYVSSTENLNYFVELSNIVKYLMILARINKHGLEEYKQINIEKYVKGVNEGGLLPFKLTTQIVDEFSFGMVSSAVNYYLTEYTPEKKKAVLFNRGKQNRLIAYGAGRIANRLLPVCIKLDLVPNEVWDIKLCQDDHFYEIPLVKPKFESLTMNDTVILFIYDKKEVEQNLQKTEASVLYYQDLLIEFFCKLN
ncbi:glycosyltransferase family 2 protein [Paenibacillus xylanexedens]|uniref:glycosyltransferase family A protein n=1 Tax=Paenibacillus xylanexedens TaxID=528191 RepID=UPI001F18D39F|nr:glycosyltransferase family 2 protein [Paenibacillus xylanexedens]MCF7757952.1 glycosyltransferase family 2 protein [Paenibacillus xylanexedens]